MPWAPLQKCRAPGCRERQAGPRCALHERTSPKNHRGIPRRLRGHGADYDRAARVLVGQPCALRFAGCTGYATGGDYIIPVSQGGTLEDGLRPACHHCQNVQGGRLAGAMR